MATHYTTLGVQSTATSEEIKNAYRKLVMQYHPDRNKNPAVSDIFKEITASYDIIGDADKRAQYDAELKFAHSDRMWQRYDYANFTQPKQPKKYIVTLSLVDAYRGQTVTVGDRNLRLPPGINSQTVYIDNNVVEIVVQPHAKFKRSGNDLLVDIKLTIQDAVLGICAIIAHIDETKLQFNIPAGTQPGQVIRLSGKGMHNAEFNCNGDLLIRCNVTVPSVLTDDQTKFFKSMQTNTTINI